MLRIWCDLIRRCFFLIFFTAPFSLTILGLFLISSKIWNWQHKKLEKKILFQFLRNCLLLDCFALQLAKNSKSIENVNVFLRFKTILVLQVPIMTPWTGSKHLFFYRNSSMMAVQSVVTASLDRAATDRPALIETEVGRKKWENNITSVTFFLDKILNWPKYKCGAFYSNEKGK